MGDSPLFEERVLWNRHDDGAFCRAIPSVNITSRGTIIAASEARFGAEEPVEEDLMYDEIPSHLVCRLSRDGGSSWSESRVVEHSDGSWWKRHGREKFESWSQLCTVTDRDRGRILMFYVLNEGEHEGVNRQRFSRVFYRTSDDECRSFGERVDITDVLNCHVDGSPGPSGTSTEGFDADHLGRAFHICIGHGVQLSTGRMIVPFWSRRTVAHPPEERNYGVTPIASDDGGATWHVLTQFGRHEYLTEHRTVELSDGSLYMNARTDRADLCEYRAWSRSFDGGASWTVPEIDRAFGRSYRCDAGLAFGDGCLVMSKGAGLDRRSHMSVSLSRDGGRSWCARRLLNTDAAFYSDLVYLGDETFGLLYLRGGLNRWRGRDVVFARLNVSWIEASNR